MKDVFNKFKIGDRLWNFTPFALIILMFLGLFWAVRMDEAARIKVEKADEFSRTVASVQVLQDAVKKCAALPQMVKSFPVSNGQISKLLMECEEDAMNSKIIEQQKNALSMEGK